MATNEAVRAHLEEIRGSINSEINTVVDYERFGAMMTAGSKATELAKVTTVPTASIHAADCAICTAWDGTSAPVE